MYEGFLNEKTDEKLQPSPTGKSYFKVLFSLFIHMKSQYHAKHRNTKISINIIEFK